MSDRVTSDISVIRTRQTEAVKLSYEGLSEKRGALVAWIIIQVSQTNRNISTLK